MAIQLTQSAAEHVQAMISKRGKGVGLRLSTKMSGCSGFSYVVDYADEIEDSDSVYECFGVKLVVKPKDLPYLDGMEVDYVRNNVLNQGFEFRNPNVKDMCGCGESFTVE